jgi:hypothetical protein
MKEPDPKCCPVCSVRTKVLRAVKEEKESVTLPCGEVVDVLNVLFELSDRIKAEGRILEAR